MRGRERFVRYVVRLRRIIELVRWCKFNARLGIVNRVNKVGVHAQLCRAVPVLCDTSSADAITEDGRSSKSRKESDEMKTLASSNLLTRHGDSLDPRVQDSQVECSDRCKAAAARSA